MEKFEEFINSETPVLVDYFAACSSNLLKRAAVDAPPATPPIIIYFMSGNLRG